MSSKFMSVLFFYLCCLPMLAFAHAGGPVSYGGFAQGLWHPVLGLDHLLAMVSVGVLSAQMGGRALWRVPVAFIVAMVVGGVAGMNVPTEFWQDFNMYRIIEVGIALSVVLLGGAIALKRNLPVCMAMAFVALFGIFHGAAHGLEIPDLALSWAYIAGFVIGTSVLHIAGVGIGRLSSCIVNGVVMLRYVGAVIAGMGLHILWTL